MTVDGEIYNKIINICFIILIANRKTHVKDGEKVSFPTSIPNVSKYVEHNLIQMLGLKSSLQKTLQVEGLDK